MKNKKYLYNYLINIGYNKEGKYVDAIFEITPKDIKQEIIYTFVNKKVSKHSSYFAFKLRARYTMCDTIHIKCKIKLTREDIENYVNSLSMNELDKLIKIGDKV